MLLITVIRLYNTHEVSKDFPCQDLPGSDNTG